MSLWCFVYVSLCFCGTLSLSTGLCVPVSLCLCVPVFMCPFIPVFLCLPASVPFSLLLCISVPSCMPLFVPLYSLFRNLGRCRAGYGRGQERWHSERDEVSLPCASLPSPVLPPLPSRYFYCSPPGTSTAPLATVSSWLPGP